MKPLKLTMSAFGPYAEKTEIDFEKYKNGLYIITGDTGAGKSTIFDAITYALYGEASTARRENSMLRSDFASKELKTYVELEFLYNDEIYKINRNPKYHRDGLKTDETAKAEMIYPDGGVKSGVKEVNSAVIELLGIDCGQFTQIAMIAQGEFLKLLLAGTEERGRIFRRIFNTDFYCRFQEILKSRAGEKRRRYEDIKSDADREMRNAVGDVDFSLYDWSRIEEFLSEIDSHIKADKKKSREIKKQEKKLKKQLEELSQALASAKKNNEILYSLSEEKQRLSELNAKEEQMSKTKSELKRIEEIRVSAVPVFERTISKRESVKRLDGVINMHKKTLADANAVVDGLKSAFEAEQKKEMQRKQFFESITGLKNEFKHYEEIDSLERSCADTKTTLEAAEKKVSVLREQIETKKSSVTGLESRLSEMKSAEADFEKAKTALIDVQKKADKVKAIQLKNTELKNATVLHSELLKEYIKAEKESRALINRYTERYNLFLREQAGIIAEELKENEPCPVCGSTEHPCAAKKSEKAPSREELDTLRGRADLSAANCREMSERAGGTKKDCELCEKSIIQSLSEMGEGRDIDEAIERLSHKTEKELSYANDNVKTAEDMLVKKSEAEIELKNLIDSLEENEKLLQNSQREANDLTAKLSGFKLGISAIKAMVTCDDKTAAEHKLTALECEYGVLVKQYEDSEAAYRECLNNIDKSKTFIADNAEISKKENDELKAEEQKLAEAMSLLDIKTEAEISVPDKQMVDAMHIEVQAFDDELKRCRERVNVLESTTAAKEIIDIVKIEKEKRDIDEALDEVSEIISDLNVRISVNDKVRTRTEELAKKLSESENEYALFMELSQTANGELPKKQKIAFEQYIQSAYFKSMLSEANKRFSYMTNNRFELVKRDGSDNLKSRGGLEIDVYDNYTGKCRDIKTLSGGESFKASLCMALGLSEVIQRNSGGVRLDAMFVDEGFGVLDEESLSQAVEVLVQLSESDRMVGIISHISELKDRIDKKIVVKRDSKGSSLETIY